MLKLKLWSVGAESTLQHQHVILLSLSLADVLDGESGSELIVIILDQGVHHIVLNDPVLLLHWNVSLSVGLWIVNPPDNVTKPWNWRSKELEPEIIVQ